MLVYVQCGEIENGLYFRFTKVTDVLRNTEKEQIKSHGIEPIGEETCVYFSNILSS